MFDLLKLIGSRRPKNSRTAERRSPGRPRGSRTRTSAAEQIEKLELKYLRRMSKDDPEQYQALMRRRVGADDGPDDIDRFISTYTRLKESGLLDDMLHRPDQVESFLRALAQALPQVAKEFSPGVNQLLISMARSKMPGPPANIPAPAVDPYAGIRSVKVDIPKLSNPFGKLTSSALGNVVGSSNATADESAALAGAKETSMG